MKMRPTRREARGSAVHNGRDFDLSKAVHVDPERAKLNRQYIVPGLEGDTLREREIAFYDKIFAKHIEYTNNQAKKSRHKERMTSAEKLYSNEVTSPREVIYQIGDMNSHVPPETLWRAYSQFYKWHAERFPNIAVIDAILHADEKTPHIHERKVYLAKNKHGFFTCSIDKCLEEAGIHLPDEKKVKSRHNNRKMEYTRICRERWLEIIKELGIDIETEPIHGRHHVEKAEYIEIQLEKEIKDLSEKKNAIDLEVNAITDKLNELRSDNHMAVEELNKAIEALKEVSRRKALIEDELAKLEHSSSLNDQLACAKASKSHNDEKVDHIRRDLSLDERLR